MKGALGFEHATLTLQAMPAGSVMLNVTSGIASPWLERIPEYGEDIVALWGGARAIAAAPMDEPVILSRMNPEVADGSSRNRYFLEWRRPQGLIDTVAIGLLKDRANLAAASFVRHERQGPIGDADVGRVDLFAPHLRRAVNISRLLDLQAVRAATFEAVLDGVCAPVFLVGEDLELVHANRAGGEMLQSTGGISLARGRLALGDTRVQSALEAAVRRGTQAEALVGGAGFGLPFPDAEPEARAIHVLPLTRGELRPGLKAGAAAAVFVSTGSAPSQIRELAATLYDLSRSEASVFERIALGDGAPEAAEALGVSASTVRTHLLRIYQKTGVHRQSQLVRLAAGLRSPL